MSRHMINKHVWRVITIVTFVSSTLLVAIFLYWTLNAYKTADIDEPIKILNPDKQIAPGEKIVMELHITKYNLYPVKTYNAILCDNGRIYIIGSMVPSGKASLPVGSFVRVQDTYSLPNDVEAGTVCHFEFQNTYEVNPVRNIIKTWKSEDFSVKE